MHPILRASAVVIVGLVIAAATISSDVAGAGAKFYRDDPIAVEPDSQDASNVQPWTIDLATDLTYNLFFNPGDRVANVGARNVNTIDEVPDSNWFTNRLGRRVMTAAEIAKGPDQTDGPAAGQWIVSSSKSDGITPGFTVRDANGRRWFIKFDAPGYRGMATGTEVAVTKLAWALGYHVPENHLAFLRPEQLIVGEGAKFTPPNGTGATRPMQKADIDALLRRADREPDGSYRVIASLALEGKPLGGFRFYDTRPDDPNDVIPHEHRRELRGYGVFAAWLNHVDAKAINSLDTLVTADSHGVVRHHLIDFGSALGSASVAPRPEWEGFEYLVEPGAAWRQMIGFGFRIPKWHTTRFYTARSIGRLPEDNSRFEPAEWKPRVPNRAFLHARADDNFWAARKLAAVSNEHLAAVIATGRFDDEKSEQFLQRALEQRRDAITRAYLPAINPIADPVLAEAPAGKGTPVLTFVNAAVDAAVATAPSGYRARWFAFDNTTRQSRPLGESSGETTRLDAPAAISTDAAAYIKVELSASGGPTPSWEKPVAAYFWRTGGEWRLVGFERLPSD
jgi:hypothetical protein